MGNNPITTNHNSDTTLLLSRSQEFGANLLKARTRLCWIRNYLSEKTRKYYPKGIHENTIHNIETGKVSGRLETIRVLKLVITEELHCEYPWEESAPIITGQSLDEFIRKSDLVQRLDGALKDAANVNMVEADSFLGLYLQRMAFVGVTLLSDLEQHLKTREALILDYAKELYKDTNLSPLFLTRGACIAILQTLLILERNSKADLMELLSKYSIAKTPPPEIRARALKKAYDRIILNKRRAEPK